jgi:oligoendopeptidase F
MHWIDEIDIKLKENWEEQMSLWYRETLDKEKLEQKAEEVREFLLDPDLSNRIDTFLNREENLVRKRKAEMLKREMIRAKVEYNKKLFQLRSEIEAKADEFLPFIKGKNVNISEMWKILMRNKNRDLRKEAHRSWKQLLGSIEKEARESIRLANKIAHEQGFILFSHLIIFHLVIFLPFVQE